MRFRATKDFIGRRPKEAQERLSERLQLHQSGSS